MNRPSLPSIAAAALLSSIACLTILAGSGRAAVGDCSQPVTDGAEPVATDCLFILNVAVGLETCAPQCICAPGGTLPATATDALVCLTKAVGQDVALVCPCDSTTSTTTTSAPPTTTTMITTTTSLPIPTSTTTSTFFNSTTTTLFGDGPLVWGTSNWGQGVWAAP